MPKLTLTDKEKVNLELYINFLVHGSNPCEDCYPPLGWCRDCVRRKEYQEKRKKYDVADLLKNEEIKEYVNSSVKLIKCYVLAQSLTDEICNLEKKVGEIMNSVDINNSKKKIDDTTESHCNDYKTTDVHNLEKKIGEITDSIGDTTEFYCNNCKTRFSVPNDKCKIAFDGECALEANVRKYYRCPKCTKICWSKDD